jgi:DNA (cytosine-5)-methyltransferase 1
MNGTTSYACGLFAGVGGIELGLKRAGFESRMLCEIDPVAQEVLRRHFPAARVTSDVAQLEKLPKVDVLAAGFPCQDLSQAGRMAGINGERFKLIDHVFRLLKTTKSPPTWLVLENVPFMLRLNRGAAMDYIVERLEADGWRWAYRTVDAQSFGIPQRRRRVLVVASKKEDPRPILLQQDAGEPAEIDDPSAYGFYWTEGYKGLGLASNAVPPLKGGFGLGIPSAPAIWMPGGEPGMAFGTPDIRDLERLQGFPMDWTKPEESDPKPERARWRLVGNAVCVGVSNWLGRRLRDAGRKKLTFDRESAPLPPGSWPAAGWGEKGDRHAVDVSAFPLAKSPPAIDEFLKRDLKPLSHKAASGFLLRARKSSLTFPDGMLDELDKHIEAVPPKARRS